MYGRVDIEYVFLERKSFNKANVYHTFSNSFTSISIPKQIRSYATLAMPSSPGHHELSVRTWSIVGTPREELVAMYGGGSPM